MAFGILVGMAIAWLCCTGTLDLATQGHFLMGLPGWSFVLTLGLALAWMIALLCRRRSALRVQAAVLSLVEFTSEQLLKPIGIMVGIALAALLHGVWNAEFLLNGRVFLLCLSVAVHLLVLKTLLDMLVD